KGGTWTPYNGISVIKPTASISTNNLPLILSQSMHFSIIGQIGHLPFFVSNSKTEIRQLPVFKAYSCRPFFEVEIARADGLSSCIGGVGLSDSRKLPPASNTRTSFVQPLVT